MRIISGKYKGRRLAYPKDKGFRPTQDRVREGIFNSLQRYTTFETVLDCFCGTGSLGLEALSRGSKQVVCIDKDIRYVTKNKEILGCHTEELLIKRKSIQAYIKTTPIKFDLIFIDPPWNELQLYSDSLKAILDFGILNTQGIIVCEYHKNSEIVFDQYKEISSKIYGTSKVTIIKK